MKRTSAVVALLSFAAAGGALACEYMDDSSAAAPAASTKMAAASQQLPAATPAPKALRTPIAKSGQKPTVTDVSEVSEGKVKQAKPVVATLRN